MHTLPPSFTSIITQINASSTTLSDQHATYHHNEFEQYNEEWRIQWDCGFIDSPNNHYCIPSSAEYNALETDEKKI